MSDAVLTFFTAAPGLDPTILVLKAATGREAMSTLYEYELTLEVNREGGLAPEDIDNLLKAPCAMLMTGTFSIEVHGVLREIELLAANEELPVIYRAVLVPQLWNTTRSYRSKVYQSVNIQSLVDQVLEPYGIEAEWWLSGSYPTHEYIVQYEETDFDFISRRLEHWGIFYFFRQEPDGEVLVISDDSRVFSAVEEYETLTFNLISRRLEHWGIFYFFRQEPDGEVLVISDGSRVFSAVEEYETLTFNPVRGRTDVSGSVHSIRCMHRPQPGDLVVRDYNYRTPSTPLGVERKVDERTGMGLQWYYGDNFKDPGEGETVARIRAEQLLNQRELFQGICSVPGLAPGHTFELLDCPIPDLNIAYLVTSVEPSLSVTGDNLDEAYEYRFTAVALKRDDPPVVPYRSQRVTPRPQIEGFMHGFVDGEVPGTAAPIDELGRYKILLPLDMVGQPGGQASRWIRMAQPSAGNQYGMHFPLHIGTEVAIIHLDGDPDRPVIMNSIPNADTVSPVVQENATQSRIRTSTGIMIEMDDDVG